MKHLVIAAAVIGAGVAVSRAEPLSGSSPPAAATLPGIPPSGKVLTKADIPAPELDAQNEVDFPGWVVGPEFKSGGRRAEWRHKMLYQKVSVEGLAFGKPPAEPSHMTGQRVVYEGSRIYVKGVDFVKRDVIGKPVRVTGELRVEGPTGTRFGTVDRYYYIQADTLRVLDRVREPVLASDFLRAGE